MELVERGLGQRAAAGAAVGGCDPAGQRPALQPADERGQCRGGVAHGLATRAGKADLAQDPRQAELAQLEDRVEAVDRGGGVKDQRGGALGEAAGVLGGDLRPVGDAEQREPVRPEHAPQVLEVEGGVARR